MVGWGVPTASWVREPSWVFWALNQRKARSEHFWERDLAYGAECSTKVEEFCRQRLRERLENQKGVIATSERASAFCSAEPQ